jgi:DNA-binding response OmpR family regulator
MSNQACAIISEPDSRIRHVLRAELAHADWAVVVAADADEVEQRAAEMTADVIVLDVSTIKLRGYSACARIRHQAGNAALPIILTAANVGTRDAAAAGTAGATALLAKPYSIGKLFQIIRPHLAANDPRRTALPPNPEQVLDWAAATRWSFGAGSGLRQDGRPLTVSTGPTVRIPLRRVT